MQISELLAAPKTQSPLKFVDGKITSVDDESMYFEISNGVVCFDPSAVESSSVENELSAMIEKARDVGCMAAIEELSNSSEYLLDRHRRKYIDLTGLHSTDTVLEIGASMGQHTRFISQKCKHLEALEVVFEQAVFAKLWCEQSGQTNVNVSAGGSDGYLPYKSNSFDALIMNYVLEWSASRSEMHPIDYHFQLLSECLRVIRPGGTIFLSTKNRYNIRLLLGGIDEHVGFRFGNALPRWLGSILGRLFITGEARGYLHSRRAIEHLFQKVGFTDLEPFLMLPDARYPEMVETFNSAGLTRIREQNYWNRSSRKDRVFSKTPYFLQKHIAPSHVYLARKPRES